VSLTLQAKSTGIGIPITFSVPFSGPGLSFQWKKDGSNISTSDTGYRIVTPMTPQGIVTTTGTATLTVLAPTLNSAGRYTCTVTAPASLAPSLAPSLDIKFDLTVMALPILQTATPPLTILNGTFLYDMPIDSHPLRRPASWVISGLPNGLSFDRTTRTNQRKGDGLWDVHGGRHGDQSHREPNNQLPAHRSATSPQTVGDFVGIIERHPLNGNLGGRINVKTTAAGGYSGTLFMGAASYPISGVLNASVTNTTGATVGGNVSFQPLPIRRATGLNPLQLRRHAEFNL